MQGCGRDNCDVTLIESVDLLCRTHGALLVFNWIPPRWRYLLGVLACVLAWAAFFYAPVFNNVVPIFVVLAVAGVAAVGLPLRLFPVAGRCIVIGWAVACALAFALSRPHGTAFQDVVTVIALVLAFGWALAPESWTASRSGTMP